MQVLAAAVAGYATVERPADQGRALVDDWAGGDAAAGPALQLVEAMRSRRAQVGALGVLLLWAVQAVPWQELEWPPWHMAALAHVRRPLELLMTLALTWDRGQADDGSGGDAMPACCLLAESLVITHKLPVWLSLGSPT